MTVGRICDARRAPLQKKLFDDLECRALTVARSRAVEHRANRVNCLPVATDDAADVALAQLHFEDRHLAAWNFGQHHIVREFHELPNDELFLPNQMDLFYSHLESLNLVIWPVEKQDPIFAVAGGPQTGIRRHSKITLTEFGKLFVAACIPAEGFEKHAKPN